MQWLNNLRDKLMGSDLAVTQPNFEQAPELRLNFSGNILRLRHAMHSATYPAQGTLERIDIYDTDNYKPQRDESFAKKVYARGWSLKGRGDRSIGGVSVSAVLLNLCNKVDDSYNCFNKSTLDKEAIQYCHDIYSRQNEGASLGNLGDGRYCYPVTASELRHKTINTNDWSSFTSGKKGHPKEVGFITAISSHHILTLRFEIEVFGKIDYYSPETNIQQACESVVKEFMENVFLELSPKSLKEKEQAKLLTTNA